MVAVPNFELMPAFGPSNELVGPMYFKSPADGWCVGMYVEARHHNRAESIHGGIMAYFIDTAFTFVCSRVRDPGLKASVTTQLAVDYIGTASAGDWIEIEVDPVRVGKWVAFFSGMVSSGSERIARASALSQMIAHSPRPQE